MLWKLDCIYSFQISPAVVDHPVNDGDHVYIWSSFSHKNQGLMKKGLKQGNAYKVECNGLSTDNDNLSKWLAWTTIYR